MASDETRPLLIKINPSWNRRPNFSSISVPPAHVSRSNSNVQRTTSKDDAIKATDAVIGNKESSRKIKFAIISILASVVLERMVYYGFIGNLVLFLNLDPFNWTGYSAMSAMFMFFGVSYTMSVLGGWISDSFLGRFKTMILSYVIYMCGYIMLPFLAINTEEESSNASLPLVCMSSEIPASSSTLFGEPCSWLIAIILIIIAIAAGMLKAIICPFGSDQLVRATQQTQLSFFNWFYWCINIGSFLGLGIITYIEQQQRFFYGFVACSVGLGFSAITFVAGFPFYTSRPPDGSVLTNIVRIFREAFRNKREQIMLQQNNKNPILNRSSSDIDNAGKEKIPFLDYAKQRYGGAFHNCLVDDVKKLGMILAVFAVLIPYWLVYFQMQTTFMFQGLNMRLSFGVSTFNASKKGHSDVFKPEIAVAWFTLCDALFVIVLLPLFDRIIYPRMARAGYHFTFAKRIILGMVFAAAAMVSAGVVEHFRWNSLDPDLNATCFRTYIRQKIGSTTYNASDMSILWQIPQYTLIGISEVFASVACLQFAVMVAPKSMKAAITGLYYFFCGIGSFLGNALMAILVNLNIWFPFKHNNSNCWYPCGFPTKEATHMCHIDYYYFFLAGFEGMGLVLFVIVAKVYKLNIDELTLHARLKNEAVNGAKGTGENITKTSSS